MSDSHRRHKDNDKAGYYSEHLIGAALGILVMGLSLAAIIAMWVWFGHEGPAFSTKVLQKQQDRLREDYGLPPQPPLPPEVLEVPPSLRNTTANQT